MIILNGKLNMKKIVVLFFAAITLSLTGQYAVVESYKNNGDKDIKENSRVSAFKPG